MRTNFDVGGPRNSRGIFNEIVQLQEEGRRAVLASPARLTGSVPCGNQSRLLIRDDGSTVGTVGGGLMEARVLQVAPQVIASGEPSILEFELTQDDAAQAGMICGGSCSMLIEPVGVGFFLEVYRAVARAEAAGAGVVLVTVPGEGAIYRKLAVNPNGTVGSTGDPERDKALLRAVETRGDTDEPALLSAPFRYCIQSVQSDPCLYIFGAGHVAAPVAHIANFVGFRTTVIDDRGEFANAERFPEPDVVLVARVEEAFSQLPIGDGSFVIAITRGHALDEEVVVHALGTPAKYIGMIGSKRKVASVFQRLHDRGFSEPDIARIHAPIGLDIGGQTVEEIALSIVAELVAVRRRSR